MSRTAILLSSPISGWVLHLSWWWGSRTGQASVIAIRVVRWPFRKLSSQQNVPSISTIGIYHLKCVLWDLRYCSLSLHSKMHIHSPVFFVHLFIHLVNVLWVSVRCQDLALCWEFEIEEDTVPAHRWACALALEGRQKGVSMCIPQNAESEGPTCCWGATEKSRPNQTGSGWGRVSWRRQFLMRTSWDE